MEVTRNNFKDSLPLISASIQKADFLVIDTEFTGLLNGKEVSMFDTPQEYYLRLLNGASDFLLIQYGLCAFYWDDEKGHYMNDAYNFYLFPRGRPGPEKMFLCQSSSLNFLASQGFDFNKLIKEGISYMTETTETRLRETLTERQKHYSQDKSHIVIPEENKKQIEEVCQQVQDFLKEKQNDEMEIDKCNAFVRRLLFQELGKRFKDEAHIESKLLENKKRVLKVTRLASAKEAEHREQLKKDKEWEDFDEAVGFSKVARMISQSEKLVVGHNMLLDILHTMNHFFQPLTPDFAAFKEFAHCMFPALLDTKYMSSLPPFKDKVNSSVLSHLLDTLSVEPFHLPKVECVEGRGYTLAQDKAHEAGFDAFVTGLCFVAMHAHVARMRGEADGARARALASTVALKPFLNKLYLARTAHQNSPYINLAGDEPTPSRDHVFFLTFPKEWLRNDINNLFSPFGLVTVQFLDDTSAIVALSQRENIKEMVRRLGKNKMVKLIPFNEYKSNLAKNTQDGKTWRRQDEDSPLKSSLTTRFGQGSPARHRFTRSIPTQQQPQNKVARSASIDSSPPITQRKRTSSGAFQIDEPPQKKLEHQRSLSDDTQKRSELKVKRKLTGDEKKVQMGNEHENKNEGEANTEIKFDSDNGDTKTEFVSAFKESDSWE